MIQVQAEDYGEYTLIEFTLEGVAEPSILKDLNLPKVDASKGVVISGRGPIWLFCAIVHHYHPVAWIATHDPRLGHVVCESHSRLRTVGEIVKPVEPIII